MSIGTCCNEGCEQTFTITEIPIAKLNNGIEKNIFHLLTMSVKVVVM